MVQEKFALSLQQDILTLLCHDDVHGKTISKIVSSNFFEGDYRNISEKALSFWEKYNTAPKQHIADLLSDILEDKQDRRRQTYQRILVQMMEVKDQINVDFVMHTMTQFIRGQRTKEVLLEVSEIIESRGINGQEEVETKLRDFLREQVVSMDAGIRLDDIDRVLKYFDTIHSEFKTGIKELDQNNIVPMRGKMMLLLAPAKRGKCVAEGERILLSDGRYIQIQDLKDGDLVPSYNGQEFLPKKASLSDNGVKEVFKVKTRSGRSVLLTSEHRLLTEFGWKPLSEISVGESIAVPAESAVFGNLEMPANFLKIIGYLIADGGLTKSGGYTFTKQDLDIVSDMQQSLSEYGYCLQPVKNDPINYYVVNKPELRGRRGELNSFLRSVGLMGKKSNQKFVPDDFFSLKKECLAVFLAALFTCDGSVYKNSKKSNLWGFEYSTTSEVLAKQVHHLLTRFGIISKLREKTQIVSERLYYSWNITILSQAQLRKLDHEIGLFFTKGTLLKTAISGSFNPSGNKTGIDRGQQGVLLFDKLVSVKSVGLKKTYDLMVEDTHNFIAENILVHNTWWLIQLGKMAFLQRKKVLHISLEIDSEEVIQRYYQALSGASKRDDLNKVSKFVFDKNGGIDQIVSQTMEVPFTFESWAIREELQTILEHFGTRASNFIVKRFPMRKLTIQQYEAYLESLETVEGFVPDLVIIDYPKIMKTDPKNIRTSIGTIMEDLRGIAQERNHALAVVHQGNRGSNDADMVKATHTSEDWSIAGTVDFMLTYSQTKAEKRLGLARLFVELGRSEIDGFGVLVTQSYRTGQFVLESTKLSDDYAKIMEGMKTDYEDEQEGTEED